MNKNTRQLGAQCRLRRVMPEDTSIFDLDVWGYQRLAENLTVSYQSLITESGVATIYFKSRGKDDGCGIHLRKLPLVRLAILLQSRQIIHIRPLGLFLVAYICDSRLSARMISDRDSSQRLVSVTMTSCTLNLCDMN